MEKVEPVLGIDLGTTYSCVATWKADNIVICPNNNGDRITPSIVFENEKEILIGDKAKYFTQSMNKLMTNSKRLIGLLYNDETIKKDFKYFNTEIIKDKKTFKPKYKIIINDKEKTYFPEDVSSMILKHLKKFSEDFIGKEVKKAVITVPAHFNNDQREATKLAAEKAGLKVIRIINEPTAAAIAYGYENKSEKERKVLVFDLGGGTFDVSILKIKGEEFTVLASCGDPHLGGEDFNELLVEYIIKEVLKKNSNFKDIDFFDKTNEKAFKALQKLRKNTEKIKKRLSFDLIQNYDIDGLYKGEDFSYEIARTIYENLCKEKWKQCFDSVDKALNISKLKKEEIDDIVLVGGSSRTPKIQEMIKEYFNKEPLKTINADEVVAYGATIVALYEDGENMINEMIKIKEITSLSIGIDVKGGYMKKIIPKGTLLPHKNETITFEKEFNFPKDISKDIGVKIYEGEDNYAWANNFLGEFIIGKEYNKGGNKVKILMSIDRNSILTIIAEVDGKKINPIKISYERFVDKMRASQIFEKDEFILKARNRINFLDQE
jgi:molecular chaperone DnaK (HSP70)